MADQTSGPDQTTDEAAVQGHLDAHYERLAEEYDDTWAHSPQFVTWMNHQVASRLRPRSDERIADIGGGTGLFTSGLADAARPAEPVLCVDPFQGMLDQIPPDSAIQPVRASVEEVAAGKAQLPYDALDVIFCKETIHHAADLAGTIRGLTGCLRPGGRMLIVTLPRHLEYPLFQAALDRFARLQPDPGEIATLMEEAGLTVQLNVEEFELSFDTENYLDRVRRRCMSVLSTFDDAELAAGVEEIRRRHPEPRLSFVDQFAFVLGTAPAG